MKRGLLTIRFEHYWHCGSGQAGEGDLDLLPVTEPCGLPYVPGRALRGRLKWAARERGWSPADDEALFGKEDARNLESMGRLQVGNAGLHDAFAAKCRSEFVRSGNVRPEVAALFEDIASTSLAGGVACSGTLRRVRYAVPVTLMAEVSLADEGPDDAKALWKRLGELVGGLRAIGKGKHDGFGWCSASLAEDIAQSDGAAEAGDSTAYDLELELLDDIVLSANSATVGGHRTLDYVPGSALIGAFARVLFPRLRQQHAPDGARAECEGALALLSAKVSFGNGAPVSAEGAATVPVPLSWHHAKDERGVVEGIIERDRISDLAVESEDQSPLRGKQRVQLRDGWLDVASGRVVSVRRTHTLKTAVDPAPVKYEAAKEAALFGYEAIAKGTRFRARVELKDTGLCQLVRDAFDGTIIRLGRSKGSEFGRARCTLAPAKEAPIGSFNGQLILLAESDLALVDEHGFPTLQPAPSFFGLKASGWRLCEERSYLRSRRYSPWNAKRGGPDLERQVISKGSVLLFTNEQNPNATASPSLRVGSGQCEGMGRLRIVGEWLRDTNPRLADTRGSAALATSADQFVVAAPEDDLTPWIEDRHREKQFDVRVARLAREWTRRWNRARGKVSPAQWGRLADAARAVEGVDELLRTLGTGGEDAAGQPKTIFGHGPVRKKWMEGDKQGGETDANVLGSLAQEIRKALRNNDDRLRLAAFRAACHRMAAQARRGRD